MENTLVQTFATQGAWALLAFYMVYYVLKTTGEREAKLHDLLDKFADKYDGLECKIDKLENKIDSKLK